MRPDDGRVLLFSEDPTITVFAPHVGRTARGRAGARAPWRGRSRTPPRQPLRVLPSLHGFWAAVVASTLGFSGIRLRKARS